MIRDVVANEVPPEGVTISGDHNPLHAITTVTGMTCVCLIFL